MSRRSPALLRERPEPPRTTSSTTPRSRRGRRPSGLSETRFAIALVAPALLLFTMIVLYPLLNSMWIGLFERSLVFPGERFVGLDNVVEILTGDFLTLLRNTLVFTAGATLAPFVVGFGLALLLNRGIRGQGLLRGVFLFPWVLPGVVVSFLWLWLLNPNYGVLNGLLRTVGVIDQNINVFGSTTLAMAAVIVAKTWNSFPWIMVMLLAGLQTIPADLIEAARVDGAAPWQRFRHVVVPHLRGIIAVVLLLEVIWNFQHFEIIYVLTSGGPAAATTTFSIALYDTAFKAFDLGRAGAIGILWMALLSVLVALYLRSETKAETS